MIEDFYRGGGGFPVTSELEENRRQILNLLNKIFHEVFNEDRALFSKELNLETWLMDDIVCGRWGSVTADFLVSKIERTSKEHNEAALIVKEELLIEDPTKLMLALKKQACKYITDESNKKGISSKDIGLREDVFKHLKSGKTNIFTLESLLEISVKAKLFRKQYQDIDLDPKNFKESIVVRIQDEFKNSGLSKSSLARESEILREDLSLIVSGKSERFTIDRLLGIYSNIRNRKHDFQNGKKDKVQKRLLLRNTEIPASKDLFIFYDNISDEELIRTLMEKVRNGEILIKNGRVKIKKLAIDGVKTDE